MTSINFLIHLRKLITKVKKRPHLYNANLPDFYNKELKEETWEEIALDFSDENVNSTVLKMQWKMLRKHFCQLFPLFKSHIHLFRDQGTNTLMLDGDFEYKQELQLMLFLLPYIDSSTGKLRKIKQSNPVDDFEDFDDLFTRTDDSHPSSSSNVKKITTNQPVPTTSKQNSSTHETLDSTVQSNVKSQALAKTENLSRSRKVSRPVKKKRRKKKKQNVKSNLQKNRKSVDLNLQENGKSVDLTVPKSTNVETETSNKVESVKMMETQLIEIDSDKANSDGKGTEEMNNTNNLEAEAMITANKISMLHAEFNKIDDEDKQFIMGLVAEMRHMSQINQLLFKKDLSLMLCKLSKDNKV